MISFYQIFFIDDDNCSMSSLFHVFCGIVIKDDCIVVLLLCR